MHAPGEADLNLYAYVHGTVLKSVDPLGLAEGENSSQEAAPQADATGSKGNDLVSEEGANQSYLESTTAMEATPSRAPMCWAAGCNPISGDTSERDRDQAMAQRGQDAQLAMATPIASTAPGVGEAMDIAVLLDPTSSATDIYLALGSLAISAATVGLSPNFGAFKTADDLIGTGSEETVTL